MAESGLRNQNLFEKSERSHALEGTERTLFYQEHLDRVSRSFAFCIARLDGALRERVGLSYLLCRVLDTVEDANWASFDEQKLAFERFDLFLRQSPSRAEFEEWQASFPADLVENEKKLLGDSLRFFRDLHEWPEAVREPLVKLVLSMSGGMKHFMRQKARIGKLVLSTPNEVNRYCFFVAGVVGEMLTRFTGFEIQSRWSRLTDAFRFGLFLQKINLLKDQRGDESSGRFLVHSRREVALSLMRDAEGAFRYLLSLPEKETGFRLFCAWSLFLGLASLPWIQKADLEMSNVKIPREEAQKLLVLVEATIHDNSGLQWLYDTLKSEGFSDSKASVQGEALLSDRDSDRESNPEPNPEEEELLALYEGGLSRSEVLELFRSVRV